jgi:serine phosphatase RsbU (regulator of sigma subunit)
MALVALFDLLPPSAGGLLPVFSVGPGLAAASGGPRRVVAAGATAVGLCLGVAAVGGLLGHTRVYVALVAILFVTAAAGYAAIVRRRTEQELSQTRALATTLEQVLLAPPPPAIGELTLAASYISAARTARIGGDLYEVAPGPDGTRIIVADVQGKGLDAVRGATVVLAAFREAAPYLERLDEVARRIELALERRTDGERFVTAVLAEVRADGGVLLLNHGHPAPVAARRDGRLEWASPATPGLPLGLTNLMAPTGPGDPADARPGEARLRLHPGERLLFYTDGISEARNGSGEFYPLLERAGGPLSEADPQMALRRLRADVWRHTRSAPDDDSALLLVDRGV